MSGIELLTCYIPITMCYNSYDDIYVLKKKEKPQFSNESRKNCCMHWHCFTRSFLVRKLCMKMIQTGELKKLLMQGL